MSAFDSPEQWLACVSDVEAPFVEEGAIFLRALLADRDRLAAELARVRPMLARCADIIGGVTYTRGWNAGLLEEIRAALAQPQDGTTEGGA